jgi:hypothetical protein
MVNAIATDSWPAKLARLLIVPSCASLIARVPFQATEMTGELWGVTAAMGSLLGAVTAPA